jgi:hypothetical protein
VDVSDLPVSGRFMCYRVSFSGDGTATPVLSAVDVTYDGTTPSRKSLQSKRCADTVLHSSAAVRYPGCTDSRSWRSPICGPESPIGRRS